MGTISSINVALTANTAGFQKGMETAERSLTKFSGTASKASGLIKGLGSIAVGAGSQIDGIGDALGGAVAGFAIGGPWGALAGGIASVGLAAYKASQQVKTLNENLEKSPQALTAESIAQAYTELGMGRSRSAQLALSQSSIERGANARSSREAIEAFKAEIVERQRLQEEALQAEEDYQERRRLIFGANAGGGAFVSGVAKAAQAMAGLVSESARWNEQLKLGQQMVDGVIDGYRKFADETKAKIESPFDKAKKEIEQLAGAFDFGFLSLDQFDAGAAKLLDGLRGNAPEAGLKSTGQAGVITSSRVSVEGLARGQGPKVQQVESPQLKRIAELIEQQRADIIRAMEGGGLA